MINNEKETMIDIESWLSEVANDLDEANMCETISITTYNDALDELFRLSDQIK